MSEPTPPSQEDEIEDKPKKRAALPPWIMALAALAPVGSGTATWYQASSAIDVQFAELRLEAVRTFAAKDDVKDLTRAIAALNGQVSELRGQVRGRWFRGSDARAVPHRTPNPPGEATAGRPASPGDG